MTDLVNNLNINLSFRNKIMSPKLDQFIKGSLWILSTNFFIVKKEGVHKSISI
jgi:hypothetical protein